MKLLGLSAVVLCSSFVLPPLLSGQQNSPRPKKILTSEQKAYQQQRNVWFSKHQHLQAQARQVFDAEMVREKAGDCSDANTTYGANICYGKQVAITDQKLKSYEAIIRELLAPPPQWPGQSVTNMHGPGGPILTPEQLTAEFDRVEQSWRHYRELACGAAYH